MQLLKELSEASAPPGYEKEVREIAQRELAPLCDDVKIDNLGNVIGFKRGSAPEGERKKVMLAGHMDEIGFYVKWVDDEGFVRLNPAGGFDPKTLIAKRVVLHCKDGQKRIGMIGTKPIHIMKDEEKKKMPTLDDLFVDLGLPGEQVKELVEIGTPVTTHQEFLEWGDIATGKCLDNRISVWSIIRGLQRLLEKGQPKHDIYAVMTVQEEVGVRGALVSAFGVEPDLGIAIDITLACDMPGVSAHEHITKLGKGVAIKVMDSYSISDRGLNNELRSIADQHSIPYQLEILPRGGTDAGGIQRAGKGAKVTTLSVPCRYVHSVVETVSKTDLNACADLLAAYMFEGGNPQLV